MAYVPKELKKELVEKLKPVLKAAGVRATFKVRHHSTFIVTIRSGKLFEALHGSCKSIHHVGRVTSDLFGSDSKESKLLEEVFKIMNSENYNNSDVMRDYFDVGYYTELKIGEWDKPYKYEES